MVDPSFNHSLLFFFCFFATPVPCWRHILSTLLWFTLSPSLLSIAVILGVPYLPYWTTRLIIRAVRLSSSGSFLTSYLWVDLCCLIAQHARLWEIPYFAFAAYLRLAELTSFPPPHPLIWHYPKIYRLPVFWAGYFPFPAPLAFWPGLSSYRRILSSICSRSVKIYPGVLQLDLLCFPDSLALLLLSGSWWSVPVYSVFLA